MEYQVELSKNATSSTFNDLVELEKNMQDQIDGVFRSFTLLKQTERYPTFVYSRKGSLWVRLSIMLMIEVDENVVEQPKPYITLAFEQEDFKVSI